MYHLTSQIAYFLQDQLKFNKNTLVNILSLMNRNICPTLFPTIILTWTKDGNRIHLLFVKMSQPSGSSCNSKQDGKEISWKAHGLVDQTAVKINLE